MVILNSHELNYAVNDDDGKNEEEKRNYIGYDSDGIHFYETNNTNKNSTCICRKIFTSNFGKSDSMKYSTISFDI